MIFKAIVQKMRNRGKVMFERKNLKRDCLSIASSAIKQSLPNAKLKEHLNRGHFGGRVTIFAIGKAAWEMANAAYEVKEKDVVGGIVITKYGHSKGEIGNLKIFEAGHPIADKKSVLATEKAIKIASGLKSGDNVLFLISGGGSSVFELQEDGFFIDEISKLSQKLIKSGVDIGGINSIRKKLSRVKGGRFAEYLKKAKTEAFVLSDVIGDRLDIIASAPLFVGKATSSEDDLDLLRKLKIDVSKKVENTIKNYIQPQDLSIPHTVIGNVSTLVKAAKKEAEKLGYKTEIIADDLKCDVAEVAQLFCSKTRDGEKPLAIIAGGEPSIVVKGEGKGGRAQHLALLMARKMHKIKNSAFIAIGSDGTDGPTDAAGGIVCTTSYQRMRDCGVDVERQIADNNSYFALSKCSGLVITGPTGTNVNDLMVMLLGKD